MTLATEIGAQVPEDPGYGDLQSTPPKGRWRTYLAGLGTVTLLVGGGWLLWPSGDDDSTASEQSQTTVASPSTADQDQTGDSGTEPGATDSTVGEDDQAWDLVESDELPDYVTEPVFYEAGTVEAEVELAYVNSVIATIHALANPAEEVPEVAYWQTGFALRATNDTRAILLDKRQVVLPGPLTRIEIEAITLTSPTEADVEVCHLLNDFNVRIDDPADRVEYIGTLHGINRLVLSPDGHWQETELVETIQDVEGFGACLDATLTPATTAPTSTTTTAATDTTNGAASSEAGG
jgi:hypothetical protein